MSEKTHDLSFGDAPAKTRPTAAATSADRASRRRFLCLDDFDRVARKNLPRMIHGFIANGAETETTMRRNRDSFADYALLPRVLTAATRRMQAVSLLGKRYDVPFGISPMGAAAACAYRADIVLAGAARAMNLPMLLSASSLIAMEEVRKHNSSLWYQAYLPGDEVRISTLLDRVETAGFEVLAITADGPLPANRENNARNGFSIPIRPSMKATVDCLLHPKWLAAVLVRTCVAHGLPKFENLDALKRPPLLSRHLEHEMSGRDRLSWRHIEMIRKRWRGKLVVKGVLAADDARLAREAGADGVILSNHGGRQLDTAISPMMVLPEVKDVAKDMSVMIDGGIRRGTDVLKALALGADFVFLGRPFLYAAAVGGEAAVSRAIAILREEIDRDLGLLGVDDVGDLNPRFLRRIGPMQ